MYRWISGFLLILFCHKNEGKRHIILLDQVSYIKVAFNIMINGKVIYNTFIHI